MRKILLVAMLGFAIVSGCSSISSVTGDDKFSESYINSHIIKGRTTLGEVTSLYGDPDSKSNYSDGSSNFIYRKRSARDDLTSLYNLVGTIPGAGSATSALAQAKNKTFDVDKADGSFKELTGNKKHDSNYLTIDFDKSGVVKSWSQ